MTAKPGKKRSPGTGSKRSAVRIIGGVWRGRKLEFPVEPGVRPTPDRVRETLFNWLRDRLDGARCLDLFAGSGALAFEALSRGAREAVLVERNRRVVDALERNRDALRADASIVRADAAAFLARCSGETFDIVFLDPPYREPVAHLLEGVLAILADGGCVYMERGASDGLPQAAAVEWLRVGRAGQACFGLAVRAEQYDSGAEPQLQ